MIFPLDCDEAYEAWGANCGPCSIAAILNMPVMLVRDYLDGFDKRRYMNVTHLKDALTKAEVRHRSIGPKLPQYGLVFVQWGGHEHKPIQAQYRFTHTIAIEGNKVFEVNADEIVSWEEWERVMPYWMKEEKRGDGTYIIRAGIEVLDVYGKTP